MILRGRDSDWFAVNIDVGTSKKRLFLLYLESKTPKNLISLKVTVFAPHSLIASSVKSTVLLFAFLSQKFALLCVFSLLFFNDLRFILSEKVFLAPLGQVVIRSLGR